MAPQATPISTLTAVASSATSSDTRVPDQTRANRSRPLLSVPNQCPSSSDGGEASGLRVQSTWSRAYGLSAGPASAATTSSPMTAPTAAARKSLAALADSGVEILALPEDTPGHVDLAAMLRALGDKGLTRVMVEGGGGMGAALLRLGLVDRIAWFRAPILLGGEGIPAVAGLELARLAEAPAFERTGVETLGDDLLETYRRRA